MSPYYQQLRKAAGNDLLLIPSVAAIIRDQEGRLLLVEKHDGSWSLPAGAVEPGESPEEAVAREVREETGLRCLSTTLLTVLSGEAFRYTYPNGDRVEYMIAVYRCAAEGEPAPLDTAETKSLRYFSRAEFPGLALPYDLALLFEA
jgi:8-oxo-dGTP pyrophosphatase MutT (NUDIX family)